MTDFAATEGATYGIRHVCFLTCTSTRLSMKTQLVVPRQVFVRVCSYVTSMALSYTLCLVVFPVCFVESMNDTR